jgi:prepilin-type N-terminal cleavage/methylation domain-containing protein
MRLKSKEDLQFGLTLIEMAVVIVVIALLVSLGLPAVRTFFDSFNSENSTRTMISAALASARAVAVKEHRYAGIRFQQEYNPESPLKANQYMIFIIHNPEFAPYGTRFLANGFTAKQGQKPLKLPDTLGVMDLTIDQNQIVDSDIELANTKEFTDTTSFSIIFSPSGKLVTHDVQIRNRDGIYQPNNDDPNTTSADDIFNSVYNISAPHIKKGMFVQDDYPDLGLVKEPSRNSFIIYQKDKFNQAYQKGQPWSDYLIRLVSKTLYVSPYTGTVISPD